MQPSFSYYTARFEVHHAVRQLRHDIRNTMALTEAIQANDALAPLKPEDLLQYRETLHTHLEKFQKLLEDPTLSVGDQTLMTLINDLKPLLPPLEALLSHLHTAHPMDPQRYRLEEACLVVCDRLAEQTRSGRNPLEGLFYYKLACYPPAPEELQIKLPDPPPFDDFFAKVAALLADATFPSVSSAANAKVADAEVLLTPQRFLFITGQQQTGCWQLKISGSKNPNLPLSKDVLEAIQRLAACQNWSLKWEDHRYTIQVLLSIPQQ